MANPKPRETEMHTLYLSDNVWGELKRRAVMEGSDASKITGHVLQAFLEQMPGIELPQRRSRGQSLDRLNRRNLHLRKDTWARIAKTAHERKYSISVLAEYLLRNYLGLDIPDELMFGKSVGEHPTAQSSKANQIPEGLWPRFQEYDPARLNLEKDASLIIQRTLEFGTWDEVRWLFATYGRQHLRDFLRRRGERLLSPVTFNYWRKLLGVNNWESSPFPTSKGELWEP